MTHKTHVAFSTNALLIPTIGYLYLANKSIDMSLFNPILAGVVIGSLLPDIDEPQSYIGKRTIGISNTIKAIFGHRGATHYLIAPLSILLIAIFVYIHNPIYGLFAFGLSYGYLFHLLGDMFTISGIRRFYFPFGKKKPYWIIPKRFRFYTNGIKENILYSVLSLLLAIELYLLYQIGGLF